LRDGHRFGEELFECGAEVCGKEVEDKGAAFRGLQDQHLSRGRGSVGLPGGERHEHAGEDPATNGFVHWAHAVIVRKPNRRDNRGLFHSGLDLKSDRHEAEEPSCWFIDHPEMIDAAAIEGADDMNTSSR
jgi:hypothetical protein